MAELWERQDGESARRFAAFQVYRDAGPTRSLRECARNSNKSASVWAHWSAKHSWQARVMAWDTHQDKVKQEAMTAEIVQMAKRHADMAMLFESKVLERLQARFLDPATGELNGDADISIPDAARIFDIATRIERTARGIVPAPASRRGPLTEEQMKDLDMQTLDELQAAVRPRALAGEPEAIALSVKIMERRAQLAGLDAPQQLTHRGDVVISEVIIERPVDTGARQDSPDAAQSAVGGAAE